MHTYVESDHAQFAAMAEYQDEARRQGQALERRGPGGVREGLAGSAGRKSAKDPLFKKVADHYLDYRKKFSVWGSSQTMKPTYVGK